MAQTLTVSRVRTDCSFELKNDDTLAPATTNPTPSLTLSLANGSGAGKANKIYAKRRTLAAGASEELDLAGTLPDPLGGAVVFTKIRVIIILLQPSPAAASLLIGGSAMNAFVNWVGAAAAQPRVGNGPTGGIFMTTRCDATGFAVTAGTGDLLKITNEDGALAATYDIILIGE
jgi:hypothetical protein